MKILISGGNGIIGSYLMARLSRIGTVFSIDSATEGNNEKRASVDLLDNQAVNEFCEKVSDMIY